MLNSFSSCCRFFLLLLLLLFPVLFCACAGLRRRRRDPRRPEAPPPDGNPRRGRRARGRLKVGWDGLLIMRTSFLCPSRTNGKLEYSKLTKKKLFQSLLLFYAETSVSTSVYPVAGGTEGSSSAQTASSTSRKQPGASWRPRAPSPTATAPPPRRPRAERDNKTTIVIDQQSVFFHVSMYYQ